MSTQIRHLKVEGTWKLASEECSPSVYVNMVLTIACKQFKDFVREYFVLCLLTPAFNISLELQRDCSDQLTLICRHSDILSDPSWIHNETMGSSQLLDMSFPGAMYSVQSNTATTPVGAVWSTPSATWWGVWATSPLPSYSSATKGETPLSWETQSC